MSDAPVVHIGDRPVGEGHPVYIVAELSANHGQDLERAFALVDAAAEAGADAVKIQTYRPDTLTIDSDREWFRVGGGTLWDGRTLYDLYGEAYTPWEWTGPLLERAAARNVALFSAPFDDSAVDFLEQFDTPAYKIASFELVDLALIRTAAATGKPLILSTGMATGDEIAEAVDVARAGGANDVMLLRCNSAYPASPAEMDLRTIPDLAARFGVPIGLSDHTPDNVAAITSVALGASMIEKHFTLRRADGGPDSAFSLEPAEFAELVRSVREAEAALGGVRYGPSEHERASLVFRRSLFVVADVAAGETFTESNVRAIRPGYGLAPRHLDEIVGRRASRAVERGTPMSWDLVDR